MNCFYLHQACSDGNIEEVKSLIDKGCDINARDHHKRTPLHCSITSRSFNNLLLNHYKVLEGESEEEVNKLEIAELLLLNKAHANAMNCNGSTPLHDAVFNKNYKMINLLLNHGAKAWFRNNEGKTPLHLAARINFPEAIIKFIQIGLNPDIIDYKGCTALHEAITYLSDSEIIKILISNGSNINWRDWQSKTPLHYCVKYHKVNLALNLLGSSADITIKDVNGFTPLHCAIHIFDASFIYLFLKSNADINLATSAGDTPLHLAIGKNSVESVRFLLINSADVNCINKCNETPLHLALKLAAPGYKLISVLLDYNPYLTIKNQEGHNILDVLKSSKCDENIVRLIIRYALKMKAAKRADFKNYDNFILQYDQNYYSKCCIEVKTLENNRLFYLLNSSIHKLSYKFRNRHLEEEICGIDYSVLYPIYSRTIDANVRLASERKKLLIKCENRLHRLFKLCEEQQIPPEIYSNILKYFNNEELKPLTMLMF